LKQRYLFECVNTDGWPDANRFRQNGPQVHRITREHGHLLARRAVRLDQAGPGNVGACPPAMFPGPPALQAGLGYQMGCTGRGLGRRSRSGDGVHHRAQVGHPQTSRSSGTKDVQGYCAHRPAASGETRKLHPLLAHDVHDVDIMRAGMRPGVSCASRWKMAGIGRSATHAGETA